MLSGQQREVVIVDPRTTDERRTRRAAFEPEFEFLEHTPGRAVLGIDRRDDSMDARFVEQRIHDLPVLEAGDIRLVAVPHEGLDIL